jgi:hypothetical protein
MFRKLTFLALLGGAVAWLLKHRDGTAEEVQPAPVVPDTSADDPLVREQEDAARADAAAIGGSADTVTAAVEPEMRPVVEGSGDAPETFEATEDEGR